MFVANILLFVNITVSVLLVIVILLQRASNGLGALGGGGSSAAFSGASAGNALTKATAILAIIFLGSSLWLAVELGGKSRAVSVLDTITVEQEAVEPADTTPEMPITLPSSAEEQNAQ
tara:strand:- start:167362 stop:167715 length:354 start_codon:yes stop_codon:yes gene_type:complete